MRTTRLRSSLLLLDGYSSDEEEAGNESRWEEVAHDDDDDEDSDSAGDELSQGVDGGEVDPSVHRVLCGAMVGRCRLTPAFRS